MIRDENKIGNGVLDFTSTAIMRNEEKLNNVVIAVKEGFQSLHKKYKTKYLVRMFNWEI